MNCEKTRLYLRAAADAELDPVHATELEAHLAQCAPCQAARVRTIALKDAFATTSLRFAPPASLLDQIERAIDREALAEPRPLSTNGRFAHAPSAVAQSPRSYWLLTRLSMAASIMLALTLAIVLLRRTGSSDAIPEIVAAHARSLLADHLVDVISTDQHTVKPWLSRRLDFSPPVHDFAARGFPLHGGRLDYIGGRTVAALVYQHSDSVTPGSDPHEINLFIWPDSSPDSSPKSAYTSGYHILSWNQNHTHFDLISDLNQQALEQLADLVRRSDQ